MSGGIAGGAFLLSFLTGLVGGAGFPLILVRAFFFALFAFALSEAIHLVVKQFLIDSPGAAGEEEPLAGSHVDISVEDVSSAEPPETAVIVDHAPPGGFPDEEALLEAASASEALDMEAKSAFAETTDGGSDDANSATPAEPPGAMDTLFSNVPMPLKDVKLPDMEHMADAFVEKKEEELFQPPPRKQTGKAIEALGKNYDPAKVANALKTLLRK